MLPFEYSSAVLDHFEHPRNVGEAEGANGVATAGSAECGDQMKLSLRIGEDGVIQEARFRTFGCVAAIAASSVTTEILMGLSVDKASAVTDLEVLEALGGLPPSKLHCSVLAEEAIRKALDDFHARPGNPLREARRFAEA